MRWRQTNLCITSILRCIGWQDDNAQERCQQQTCLNVALKKYTLKTIKDDNSSDICNWYDLNVHLTINSKTRRHLTQPQSRVRWHSPALSLCACLAGCSWAALRQESGLGGRPTLLEKGGCGRWHGSGWPVSHRECVHARSRTGPHGRVVRTRCRR